MKTNQNNSGLNPVSRIQLNSFIIDMVITCLKACSVNQTRSNIKVEANYLLSQILRQYIIPQSNWHVSKAAEAAWSTITSSPIGSYTYKQPFIADKLCSSISIPTYKGASRKEQSILTINPGQTVQFNQLFVCEHITPIADVIKALKSLNLQNNPNLRSQVTDILEKICICRILRTEDRSISRSSHRVSPQLLINGSASAIFTALYNKYYVPAGITI